jgi:hypothetical protein
VTWRQLFSSSGQAKPGSIVIYLPFPSIKCKSVQIDGLTDPAIVLVRVSMRV